jgi:hypothetical protein
MARSSQGAKRRSVLGAVADVVDLKTAPTIGEIAPPLGVLFCLRLPPTAASTFVADPDGYRIELIDGSNK